MNNKFITKIIGATLAFAMMIGGAVGINAAKEAKEVSADNSYSLTPNNANTKLSNETYITTLTEFTYSGISWKMNQWNPKTLQIKTNQSNATGEFRFYNTSAFSGKITNVVITFSAFGVSDANKLMFKGGSSEVSGTTGGTAGTWDSSAKTLTWTPASSTNYTFFAFYQNGKAASGTNYLASSNAIVVNYASNDVSKTVQANSITLKTGSNLIGSSYEPQSPYYIGDTLDLTASSVNYEQGEDYEDGNGNIDWESSNTDVATISEGIVTFVSAGSTTITATAKDKGENNTTVSASFLLNVGNVGPAHGTLGNPFTVSEAKDAIDKNTTVENAYVKGIVSKFPNNPFNSTDGWITYFISADGSSSGFQFEAYRGKGIDGANFTSASDVKIGAAVVIKGTLSKYNSTYQLNADNQLVSYVQPFTVSFETNGGSTVESQIVLDGEKAQRPADPTKAATQDYTYTFANWYDNSSFTGEPYDFETPVTDDLVLYAKWNEIPAPARDVIGRMTTGTQLSYHYTKTGDGVRDYLNKAFTGVSSATTYSNWNNKTGASGAVYAGNSCGDHGSIQLRATKPSGIITTTSGGVAKMVKIVWNSNTNDSRTIDIYGKNTAYESADDLYDANKQGTKIDTLGTSDSVLNITDDYAYIGIRSTTGALYLDSITIQWGELEYDYSDISIRFGGNVTKDLWNRLDSESTITGFGVMVTESKNVENFDEFKTYIESDMFESSENSEDYNKDIVDYYIPVASMASVIGENANNYFWNLRLDIDKANMNKTYSAIAYIKINDGYVLMNMATESVETLALDYLTNRNCDSTTAGGSLQAIVDDAQ